LEHGQVDLLAKQVAVHARIRMMARLQDDIDSRPQRVEQRQEDVEELLAGNRGGHDRNFHPGAFVAVDIHSETLPWRHGNVCGRTNGVSQLEITISVYPEMISQACTVHDSTSQLGSGRGTA